jgi:hypothetical protein
VFAIRQNLCRAFYFGRTAKRLFAVRFLKDVRQRKTHDKQALCRASKILFAVRFCHTLKFPISGCE